MPDPSPGLTAHPCGGVTSSVPCTGRSAGAAGEDGLEGEQAQDVVEVMADTLIAAR
ncbi:hypothetical protein [Streptomyces longisporoflavus]|uniref:Uncharacterized protein n=1 Tax=Streptomyces longisporoflavus TaxID=28044 RepID=A0ABW7QQS2_9ACTN